MLDMAKKRDQPNRPGRPSSGYEREVFSGNLRKDLMDLVREEWQKFESENMIEIDKTTFIQMLLQEALQHRGLRDRMTWLPSVGGRDSRKSQ